MILELKNNLTKKEYKFEVFDDYSSQSHFSLTIQLEAGMDDGEYEYTLLAKDNKVVSTGLLQIGDYVPEKQIYVNNEDKGYITYGG